MIPVTSFKGKRVALFGLGGSGLVSARALQAGGAEVVAYDDNPDSVARARDAGIATNDLRDEDFFAFDALLLAPGVPLTHPMPHWTVERARQAGIPIIGDIELFARELALKNRVAPMVAITGTNGKSTTTALIAHVLKSAGRDFQMGGNIGRAILDLDPISGDDAANQVYVVECSSYQIDLAPSLAPHVGVLLNITPDHLERHGSFENYAAIKERLVARSDLAVCGIDDASSRAIATRLSQRGTPLMAVSCEGAEVADIAFHDGQLMRVGGEALVDLSDMGALRGRHNGQNAAAAYAVCEALGLSREEIAEGFGTFPGLAHRMQQVGWVGNVLFINDSKATNAEAAAPALSSFKKVRWIAGGLPKDGGIESLAPHFERITKAYLIGEAAAAFASQLNDTIRYEISGTLQQAVNHAAADALESGEEEVILLSPAAASFDQFRNFEVRGEAFVSAVEALDGFRPV